MANWRDGKIFLMSRGNKQYRVNHIEEQLTKLLDKKDSLDGELYVHSTPLATINSYVKKWKPGVSNVIEYHVYDVPHISGKSAIQADRVKHLAKLNKTFDKTNIKIVETHTANSWDEIVAFEKQFIKEGYEGAIVRLKDGIYEFGNRSDSLLKVKTFQDGEFKVTGFKVEASNINGKKIDAVVWVCKNDMKSPDGTIKTFEVRPKGTFEDRADQLKNVEKYIGKKLTVKYFDRTPDNIPFHATGMLFRLKEDLPDES